MPTANLGGERRAAPRRQFSMPTGRGRVWIETPLHERVLVPQAPSRRLIAVAFLVLTLILLVVLVVLMTHQPPVLHDGVPGPAQPPPVE
jgi:hypothetical protein